MAHRAMSPVAPTGRAQEHTAVISSWNRHAFSFTLDASTLPEHAQLSLSNTAVLTGHLWRNSPRLDRVSSGGMALHVSDRHLTAVAVQGVELENGQQRFTLWVNATPRRSRDFILGAENHSPDFTKTIDIPVEVLDIRLPQP